MARTKDVDIDEANWVAANDGDVTSMIVQMKTSGTALVQVTNTQPQATNDDGIWLDRLNLGAINLTGLAAGDVVWVRALDGEARRVTTYQVS